MSDNVSSREMIENSFFANLKPKVKKQINTQIANSNNLDEIDIIAKQKNSIVNTEKLLLNLYDVRDWMITLVPTNKTLSSTHPLIENINMLCECIRCAGGEADDFDPIANISGLQSPNIKRLAQNVINNTKDLYTLGKITSGDIKEDGKTIVLTFEGVNDKVEYKAVSTIKPNKSWLGCEAIDYIYTPGEGKLFIKSPGEDGNWLDKSSDYNISWELYENSIKDSSEVQPQEKIVDSKIDEEI